METGNDFPYEEKLNLYRYHDIITAQPFGAFPRFCLFFNNKQQGVEPASGIFLGRALMTVRIF